MNIVSRLQASVDGMEWADTRLDERHPGGNHCHEDAPCSETCAELWARWRHAYLLCPWWIRATINFWYYATLCPMRDRIHDRLHKKHR